MQGKRFSPCIKYGLARNDNINILTPCSAMHYNKYHLKCKGETMGSQLTVRLPEDLDQEITDAARRLRLKRSDIVRMALEQYLREPSILEEQAPYGKVKHLVGSVKSGISDLGASHREHLVKRLKRHE